MSLFRLYLLSPILLGAVASVFQNRKKAFFVLYGVITFLFYALRTQYLGIGHDSIFYYELWEHFSTIPFNLENIDAIFAIDLEKGFLITVWVISKAFPSGQFMYVFAALVYTYCLCTFVADNCDDYVLGFLMVSSIGLTGFFLQGTRQAIAICICLLSVKYCRQRKMVPFFLIVLLASSVHASAMLFLVVYFSYGCEINWKSILIVVILGTMAPIILNRITLVADLLMNENYSGGSTDLTTGGTATMALYITLLLYCIVIRNSPHQCYGSRVDYTDYSHAFFMSLICTTFFSLRFFYITVFERASYYFLPFVPVAVSATYDRYSEESKKYARILLYIVFTLLALYKSGASSPLSQYRFFWSE